MKARSRHSVATLAASEQDKTGNVIVAIFVALCAAFVWMLMHQASAEESANLALADRSLPLLFKSVAQGAQMPFYYLLLHSVGEVFGSSIVAARLLSLVLYLAIPFVAYKIGRRIDADEQTGRVAAALMGLSPFVLWYGNKATPYALLALLTLINQYFYIGMLLKHKTSWIGYLISGIAGLLTHYFFALIVLVQVGFYAAKCRNFTGKQHVFTLGTIALLVGVLFLWIQYAASVADFWGNIPQIARPSATDVFITYIQFLFGIQSVTVTTLILSLWPFLVVVALLGVQKYMQPPLAIEYFIWAGFVPIVLIFGLSWLWRPTFLASYLIICLPAFLLFLSWFLTATDLRSLRWVRYTLIVTMMVMMVIQFFFAQTPIQNDYPRDRRIEERLPLETNLTSGLAVMPRSSLYNV